MEMAGLASNAPSRYQWIRSAGVREQFSSRPRLNLRPQKMDQIACQTCSHSTILIFYSSTLILANPRNAPRECRLRAQLLHATFVRALFASGRQSSGG